MLIDFHTHIFPDKIAAGAVKILKDNAVRENGDSTFNHTDGTLNGLKKSMKEENVDISVIMPIATKPSQTQSINRFAENIRCDSIVSFGSVYPGEDDWKSVLSDLVKRGFKGIKLHPEYQNFYVDSKNSIELLIEAEKLGLYVTFHAGQDIGLPPPVHCNPDKLKNVLEYVNGDKIIAAHLGGFREWDSVEKYLVGTNIIFDTAFISEYIEPEQCKRIIENHGCDKILFATDSPWETPSQEYKFIDSLGFSQEDKNKIYYKNALKILN